VFFGAALGDVLGVPQLQKATMEKLCKNTTFKDFETSHWPQMQAPEEVNKELLAWIESL
jgi:pimeloyl-ACP methyl ester carboxylesterase